MSIARRDFLALIGSLPLAAAISSAATAVSQPPEAGDDPDIPPSRTLTTLFNFTASVPAVVGGGGGVDVWIPIPSDDAFQAIRGLSVSAPVPYQITHESRFGNHIVYLRARPSQTPLIVNLSFVAIHKSARLLASVPPRYRADSPVTVARALQPDARVPTGDMWRKTAQAIVDAAPADTSPPMRALYDHVIKKIDYDDFTFSSESGKGDAAYVSGVKKGDSLDLSSYLVALARSIGIPCYIEFGVPVTDLPAAEPAPTQGEVAVCHAYVWFRDGARGWLPLDVADGRRWANLYKPALTGYLFGNLLTPRAAVTLSHGRDLTLDPPQRAEPLNTFASPYAEADGVPVTVGWRMHYTRPETPNIKPNTSATLPPERSLEKL